MDQSKLDALYNNWKFRNYDLVFYFKELFEPVIHNLIMHAKNEINLSSYKALFMPVGFSIENIALVAVALKPQIITLAMTDATRYYHRPHINLVENLIEKQIRKSSQATKINQLSITSDDQRHMEQKIVEWVEEMKNGYGISYKEMAIDLTGGTKPMSIGAHNAAISFEEIDAFYLQTDYDLDTMQPMPGTERLIKVKKTTSQVDENTVFVAMPFKDEFKDIYEKGIQAAIDESGKKCVRVDEQVFTGPIMEKINDNILKANVIVTELTEYNPNVFYELGLANGYNKKVIMLTQDISKIPFDLRHLRIVNYEKNKLNILREKLKIEILNIIK